MSWFDVLKRIDFQQDWTVTPERTNFGPAAPIPTPPQRQAQKITSRKQAIKEKLPLEIKDDDLDCPLGMLWCEEHEECEVEEEWKTHNSIPTEEDLLWAGSQNVSTKHGPKQYQKVKVATKEKPR